MFWRSCGYIRLCVPISGISYGQSNQLHFIHLKTIKAALTVLWSMRGDSERKRKVESRMKFPFLFCTHCTWSVLAWKRALSLESRLADNKINHQVIWGCIYKDCDNFSPSEWGKKVIAYFDPFVENPFLHDVCQHSQHSWPLRSAHQIHVHVNMYSTLICTMENKKYTSSVKSKLFDSDYCTPLLWSWGTMCIHC